MEEVKQMHMLDLEEEYERNAPTFIRLADIETRKREVSDELIKKYKAEIERLTKPRGK